MPIKRSDLNAEISFWYAKLKESGFKDIEQKNGTIANPLPTSFKDYDSTVYYFEKASDFLNVYCFRSEIEKRIWELHIEGLSVRKIANQLNVGKSFVGTRQRRISIAFKAWVNYGIT